MHCGMSLPVALRCSQYYLRCHISELQFEWEVRKLMVKFVRDRFRTLICSFIQVFQNNVYLLLSCMVLHYMCICLTCSCPYLCSSLVVRNTSFILILWQSVHKFLDQRLPYVTWYCAVVVRKFRVESAESTSCSLWVAIKKRNRRRLWWLKWYL